MALLGPTPWEVSGFSAAMISGDILRPLVNGLGSRAVAAPAKRESMVAAARIIRDQGPRPPRGKTLREIFGFSAETVTIARAMRAMRAISTIFGNSLQVVENGIHPKNSIEPLLAADDSLRSLPSRWTTVGVINAYL